MKDSIIFFGTEDFSALTLKQMVDDGFAIDAVITKPDFKKGRGKNLTQPAVKSLALKHNIKVVQPKSSAELKLFLKQQPRTVGVLVSYGKIIPQSIIDIFKFGIVNLHPSLLPKYRGPAPIETALLNGDEFTGVSIMSLDKGMDTGPVYVSETIKINNNDDAIKLYDKLGRLGAKLVSSLLPDILNGNLIPVPQDDPKASYTHLLKKTDGLLDYKNNSAEQLARQVKAHLIYPKSFIMHGDQRLVVKKAHSSFKKEHLLSYQAADENFFVIDSFINKNGKLVTALDYINSTKS